MEIKPVEKQYLILPWIVGVFFLFFIFHPFFLLAQEQKEIPVIEHTPINSFTHGEKLKITARVSAEVEQMRFFFRAAKDGPMCLNNFITP